MTRHGNLRRGRAARATGHTLVETMVAGTVLAVVVGGVVSMLTSSQQVYSTIVRTTRSRHDCSMALAGLGHESELASNATLAVVGTAPDGDLLKFQSPLSVANGVVTWGAREGTTAHHVDHPNAFVEYLVVVNANRHPQRSLVRRMVDATGAPIGTDVVVVDGIDSPQLSTGKGFKVVRNQRQLTLTVRTRSSTDRNETDRGKDLIQSQQLTIRLRNS